MVRTCDCGVRGLGGAAQWLERVTVVSVACRVRQLSG